MYLKLVLKYRSWVNALSSSGPLVASDLFKSALKQLRSFFYTETKVKTVPQKLGDASLTSSQTSTERLPAATFLTIPLPEKPPTPPKPPNLPQAAPPSLPHPPPSGIQGLGRAAESQQVWKYETDLTQPAKKHTMTFIETETQLEPLLSVPLSSCQSLSRGQYCTSRSDSQSAVTVKSEHHSSRGNCCDDRGMTEFKRGGKTSAESSCETDTNIKLFDPSLLC